MNNHYEMCLTKLDELLQKGQKAQALALVQEELSMPYVPQDFLDKFEKIRDQIVVDQRPHSQYFEDAHEIGVALHGNGALKEKALMSLQRMNLRFEMELLSEVFEDIRIEDWIKKQCLLMLMQQEINTQVRVCFSNNTELIDTASLVNPIGSEAYMACRHVLIEKFESDNPSYMFLCLEMLDMNAMDSFPNNNFEFDASAIIAKVEKAFGNDTHF